MAIIHEPFKYDEPTHRWVKSGEVRVTHEGRVAAVYNRELRAMSDVYTLATYATVVNDDGVSEEVLVNANFECDMEGGYAKVDITDELRAKHVAVCEEAARVAAALRKVADAAKAEENRLRELNRPVKGKRMVVAKGRKVPVGFAGTVAYVSGSGSVLLKADAEWQDRKAQGTWVPAANLKARA